MTTNTSGKVWNAFAQWLDDKRWAANMRRIRRFRRELGFSDRQIFDAELRPFVGAGVIAYPDATYHIRILDLTRAMDTVSRERQRRISEIRARRAALKPSKPGEGPHK